MIDEHVFAKLRTLRSTRPTIAPTSNTSAAYLDLLGVLPTPAEARAFERDATADKRRLGRRRLLRPEYAEQWALKWADLLRVEEPHRSTAPACPRCTSG